MLLRDFGFERGEALRHVKLWGVPVFLSMSGYAHGAPIAVEVASPPAGIKVIRTAATARAGGIKVSGELRQDWHASFPLVLIAAQGCDAVEVKVSIYNAHVWGRGRFAGFLQCSTAARPQLVSVSFSTADGSRRR